jgi:hypothetical protein
MGLSIPQHLPDSGIFNRHQMSLRIRLKPMVDSATVFSLANTIFAALNLDD